MRCSQCGNENPPGQKFCGDCGAALANLCPNCGADNPAGKRFCGECGAALGAPLAASAKKSEGPQIRIVDTPAAEKLAGERKTVTALFADIKGSTELMEDLDPEEARAIIDPALKLMIDAVQRYDGYVVQSTGDGIFALFGAPVAHEDHPQRALYAALRMQEEMRRYSAKLREAGDLPVEARVGVNTGEVVVRSISTGGGHVEYTPIGHTANLASRMQALAPTGSIAVSENTRKLCEGYFALKPLGPTKVKGVSEPVNVYEVTGLGPLRTRLQRSAGRGLTKFVGREREMEAMRAAAERATSGHGQIVAAMAEAGTGKSRLVFEFKAKHQSGWMVLETFSVSHGKASAYLPIIDLLHTYFDIKAEDDARKRRERVTGRVVALDRSLEDALPYLFALLGIVEGDDPLAQMDGQIRKRRTLEAIKRILLRESMNQPLMAIFEDLHWIDEATQDFLNLLADSIGTAKILLLANYRPEYSHQWNSKTYYTQLRLDPLGKESADEMLAALLGEGDDLAALKHLIIDKTEGNPFFMEETVQVLFDEGALVRDGTAVKLTRSLNTLKIPPTVQGILASRIDRLPPDAKDLLQALAVIGREFPLSLIRAVVPKSDDELNRLLNDLQLGEFIYEQPAVGDTEYIFKHALTQEVAYNSVLIERRKQLHERIGAALEALYAKSLDDHLAELAHHYGRSNNPAKALQYMTLAGEQAMRRSANHETVAYLRSALERLKELPESAERDQRELDLLLKLGPALIAAKGNAASEVEQAYLQALGLAERIGEASQQFPALFGLRSFCFVQGEILRAHELGEQLLSLAQNELDPGYLLEAHLALGNTLHFQGALIPSRIQFEQALKLYDPMLHRSHAFIYGLDPGPFCLLRISSNLASLGYLDQALEKARAALALAREASHPVSLAVALLTACGVYLLRRDLNLAQGASAEAIKIAEEQGLANLLGQATIYAGAVLAQQGRTSDGIERIQQGRAACQATGAVLLRPFFVRYLADAYLRADQPKQGLLVVDEMLALLSKTHEHFCEAELWRFKGEFTLQGNRADPRSGMTDAEDCFRQAITVAQVQEAKFWELRATTSLARLLLDTNRREEARNMLADIYNWFTEGFDTADLIDAKALLDELRP